jgi:paraquat-inducible protein A
MSKTSHDQTKSNGLHCPECGLIVDIPQLTHKQKATCPRCSYVLSSFHENAHTRSLAYAVSGFLMLFLVLPFEFVSFSARGQQQSIDLLASLGTLIESDYLAIALFQFIAIFIIPATILLSILYLLIPLQFDYKLPFYKQVYRLIFGLVPWSMAEIFLLGVLVALIKMTSMAEVHVGLSFYAYIGFTLFLLASLLYLDKHQLMLALGVEQDPVQQTSKHEKQNQRSRSIQRTWALLATAVMLYIPSNLLPVMTTRILGREEPNTILGGVVALWESGSYPIATIIFIASVVVPILKLMMLGWLNYSVQTGSALLNRQRILCYRITEFIGRWSMIDVFVVAILVSLIQLGNTMTIYPGPAAIAFCCVVIITMFAAMTFDTRLIWEQKTTK